MYHKLTFCLLFIVYFLSLGLLPKTHAGQELNNTKSLKQTCTLIDANLSSVSLNDCLHGGLIKSGSFSVQGYPLLVKEYPPLESRAPQSRVLLLGGTHGDEFASISVVFKWMKILDKYHSGLFHWIFVPLLNPDGLFHNPGTRTNSRGVDLNRNNPSPLWKEVGYTRWEQSKNQNPRYYPGSQPASEPETRFLVTLIRDFKPDAIISLHAPLKLVDYDGPGDHPRSLGSLPYKRLGNFPGTLGNFAGITMDIPVITLELASSTSMPSAKEISTMWMDLVRWLINNTPVIPQQKGLKAKGQDTELKKEFFGK